MSTEAVVNVARLSTLRIGATSSAVAQAEIGAARYGRAGTALFEAGEDMTRIRILVIDDHHVFRNGMRSLISVEPDLDLIGEASSTDDAVEAAEMLIPDVILMDLHLPGLGGLAATRSILQKNPSVRVLVLTMYDDDVHLQDALGAGARGYVLKNADPDAIVGAIRAVHRGQVIFDPAMAPSILSARTAGSAGRPFSSLTDREFEVLDRLALGLRNDAIASRLHLSLKTVQNNVSSILLKLGARDRAQAVAIARDAGVGAAPLSTD